MKIKITRQHVRASVYGTVLILIAGSIPGYFAMFPDQMFFYVLVLSIHAGNFLLLHIGFQFWDAGRSGLSIMAFCPVGFISSVNAVLLAGFIYHEFFFSGRM